MIKYNIIEPYYKSREDVFNQISSFPGEPEMTVEQSGILCGLLRKKKPHRIVEVGVAGGGTTAIIISCVEEMGYKCDIYSVDYSTRFYRDKSKISGFLGQEALDVIKPQNIKHRFLLGKIAADWVDELQLRDIDCLILDTMHTLPGEVLDFISLLPYLSEDALVILHDTAFNLVSRERFGFATPLLFSSVTAEKYISINDKTDTIYPNIAAFEINSDTRTNIEQLLLSLVATWKYIPDDDQLRAYKRILEKNYDKEFCDHFDIILHAQKTNVVSRGSKYRFPFGSVRRNEKVIIWGAGMVGKEYYHQAVCSGWSDIVAWVDKQYSELNIPEVGNPYQIRDLNFDYIIVAVEKEIVVDQIKKEIMNMGIEKEKVIWVNPCS